MSVLIGICFLFKYCSFFVFIYFTFLCSFHCMIVEVGSVLLVFVLS